MAVDYPSLVALVGSLEINLVVCGLKVLLAGVDSSQQPRPLSLQVGFYTGSSVPQTLVRA